MVRVTEQLAEQFADLPVSTVLVVTDRVAGDLDPDPGEVYRSARAELAALSDHPQQETSA